MRFNVLRTVLNFVSERREPLKSAEEEMHEDFFFPFFILLTAVKLNTCCSDVLSAFLYCSVTYFRRGPARFYSAAGESPQTSSHLCLK